MTLAQIATISRFLTNTNSVTVSDANFIRLISERHKQMLIELSKLKEGYGDTTASANLVNGTQTVALPTDCLRLKRAEIQYATSGTWYPVRIFDINEKSSANDTSTVAGEFSKTDPWGDIQGNNISLYPIPDASVTNGLKFWYTAVPADFSATSETPSAPTEYHRYLADLVAIDIRSMKNEISPSQAMMEEQGIWQFLKNQVSPRVTGQDPMMKPLNINYE